MKVILALLLLSGAVESYLYFPNIQDLKDFTKIDFGDKPDKPKNKESKPASLDLDNSLDWKELNKNMLLKMITLIRQEMAIEAKKEIGKLKPKSGCAFCRI